MQQLELEGSLMKAIKSVKVSLQGNLQIRPAVKERFLH